MVDVLYVGERGLVALVLGYYVRAAVADNVNHLGHLRTGYDLVRTERAVFVTFDYVEGREHVNGFSLRNVSLIRECRTSEHGERARERQHQCENLFEILHGVFPP